MYDRHVDVPRLLCFYDEEATLPDPVLTRARDALSHHYAAELGEPFRTAGLCYYRDGRDSVAWHGDRIGRGNSEDTMVAIVSVGAPRALLLRPRGGGPTLRHALGLGDLIVMGGSCQRTWNTRCRRRPNRWARGSASSSGHAVSVEDMPRRPEPDVPGGSPGGFRVLGEQPAVEPAEVVDEHVRRLVRRVVPTDGVLVPRHHVLVVTVDEPPDGLEVPANDASPSGTVVGSVGVSACAFS